MAPPPPPPPPPPLCFPFTRKKTKRLADSGSYYDEDESKRSSIGRLRQSGSYSPTATLTSRAEKLSFDTDSEQYSMVPSLYNQPLEVRPTLRRSQTTKAAQAPKAITNKGGGSKRWGWGLGKRDKEKEVGEKGIDLQRQLGEMLDLAQTSSHSNSLPRYPMPESPEDVHPRSPEPMLRRSASLSYVDAPPNHTRSNTVSSKTTQSSTDSKRSKASNGSKSSRATGSTGGSGETTRTAKQSNHAGLSRSGTQRSQLQSSQRSQLHSSQRSQLPSSQRSQVQPSHQSQSGSLHRSQTQASHRTQGERSESSSTLVGEALQRKANFHDMRLAVPNSSERLKALRAKMEKEVLDYYVILSEDAHGSEYVAINDKRREWISGFTGSAGQAVVSKTAAYLITDSRYWLQAERQLDTNWKVIQAGSNDGPKDWIEWLVERAKDAQIGVDARMLSHEKATLLNKQLAPKGAKLKYPTQNLVDLIWENRPSRPLDPVFVQPFRLTGVEASRKLGRLRKWIESQPPMLPSYTKREPTDADRHIGTLISNLSCIAWLLNLRGDDIPFNPVFHSYLFVSLTEAILFIEDAKILPEINDYLKSIGVEHRAYNAVWTFLRGKPWGAGKVIITPQTSYAISLMLSSPRYTVLPSPIEEWKAVKNDVELEGLKNAYVRDGVAFVRWFAWIEQKMNEGYDITEWEAAWRLTEFRRMGKLYRGLAYESISATGANAAQPHYTPYKSDEILIERETPYLNDSGGQYQDGTCDTTRTVHFGRPTAEQCEAFTRVLQGHIAIDSAVFPAGTTGAQLDVLARKALWQDGMNYLHGTGHGVGSYLNVHEGPHGFTSSVPLEPGHVITNEPGYYKANHFGVRIESALYVRHVMTKHGTDQENWLGFERLTCVPIQTKMVKDSMLTKEERQWLKDHNRRCYEVLEPLLRDLDDKRALKWLKREAERGIGIAGTGPAGLTVDWK